MKDFVNSILGRAGYEIRKKPDEAYSEKATAFSGRFREILSDPLNCLIARVPAAGIVRDGLVTLHTGLVVPVNGSGSYYDRFSEILVLNRGVHEPLEEFVFQEVVRRVRPNPTMLELGAYWGHYSMWLKQFRPDADLYLVEPDIGNLQAGVKNFERNKMEGTFINAMVGPGHFEVDKFMDERNIDRLDILHADIQGAEAEMLGGCQRTLRDGKISYCFISTHSQDLHAGVQRALQAAGFRIEASADVDRESTSFDGLVFAAHQSAPPVLKDFEYLGREQIVKSSPEEILAALNRYSKSTR
ncbi:FkbM family methyltransferase [Bradyrhizobium diazoefficiens]|nr:FkbM family methyltransferase [Bradyrhizobium diazoefficiens]MBR0779579.1 FkbM family methyltransferase [Bradyrhizobium diazoefficiens]